MYIQYESETNWGCMEVTVCRDMEGGVGSNWETLAVACSLSLNSLRRVAAVEGGGGAPTLGREGHQLSYSLAHSSASLIHSIYLFDLNLLILLCVLV